MSLQAGTRVGPYEIVASLGAGGMGEVYRARDNKLDRDVAVKVLPGHLAADPSALARFEREAKAVAALSHPNILAIFDFGQEQGTAYAVTEFLDGMTLREKLGQTPAPGSGTGGQGEAGSGSRMGISIRKALDYGVQIARGLAAAHEKGIVHRDLKPENIFVTASGQVKILDFGLARRLDALAASETMSPTIGRFTDPGTVLGTVGYMSPEQVRGEPGDHRSDIFSFGAVLYELVSGRRAFQRSTAAETMTAILREETPPLDDHVSGGLPPALGHIVQHCLEKSPGERFQSASDIAFALQALPGSSPSSERSLAVVPGSTKRWLWPAAAAVAAAAIAIAGFVAGRLNVTPPSAVSFTPLTYVDQTIFRGLFAPDGKTIVFSSTLNGVTNDVELFTLSTDYPEPRPLGLRNTQLLSVSPRGELAVLTKVRFLSHRLFEGTLARAPLGGGAPREILEHVREADWAPDGEALAIIRDVSGIDRLEFPIGKVLYESSGYLSDLRVSPTGDRIAFLEHPLRYDDRGGVAVVDLKGTKTTLTDGYWGLEGLAWSKDGREVLFAAGLSYAQFMIYGVTLTGERRQALESAGGLTIYDIAADGRWLAARDDISRNMFVKAPGAAAEANLSWLDFSSPVRLTKDGRTLLFTEESGAVGSNYAVCLRATDGSPVVKLGEGTAADLSPDGRFALGIVQRTARDELMLYPTGAGEPRGLDPGPIERYIDARWFPDGARVVVCGNGSGVPNRCYVQDTKGGPPQPITPERTDNAWPSPDGASMLVHQTRVGTAEESEAAFAVYPIAGGAPRPIRWLRDGADAIVAWNPDGKSLLVSSQEGTTLTLSRVDLATGRRDFLRALKAGSASGRTRVRSLVVADDPDVYAYEVARQLSRMFLIRGVQSK